MADIQLDTQSAPTTPGAGSAIVYVDSTNKELTQKDDGGTVKTVRTLCNAGSTTTAGANIYIVGSNIAVPPTLVRVGSVFQWTLWMSKTAACTSAPVYNVVVGTAGTTADTVRLTWTSASAQTAATDNGILMISAVVTTAGASGVINGSYNLDHKNASTGFASVQTDGQGPTASSAFDLTVANLIFGLTINPGNTGANAVWTITTIATGMNL